MATWIRYDQTTDDFAATRLIDLERVSLFVHCTKTKQKGLSVPFVELHFGATYLLISEKESAKAYHKVLDYMRQLE